MKDREQIPKESTPQNVSALDDSAKDSLMRSYLEQFLQHVDKFQVSLKRRAKGNERMAVDDLAFLDEATLDEDVASPDPVIHPKSKELFGMIFLLFIVGLVFRPTGNDKSLPRPPLNAEYLLYFVLPRDDREVVIGDLLESYGRLLRRFSKRRADFWYYKEVVASMFPLAGRALLKIGALVWLGRVLRRLIS